MPVIPVLPDWRLLTVIKQKLLKNLSFSILKDAFLIIFSIRITYILNYVYEELIISLSCLLSRGHEIFYSYDQYRLIFVNISIYVIAA